jgi:hypothetical protein
MMLILTRAALVAISSLLLSERCTAVPAIVWSKTEQRDLERLPEYTSEELVLSQFVASLDLSSSSGNDLSVLFLLGRNSNGSESVTSVAPFLTKTQQEATPTTQHMHVSGLESGTVMIKAMPQEIAPLLINLNEWSWKLNSTQEEEKEEVVEMDSTGGIGIPSKSQVKQSKRTRAVDSASCLIVQVPSDIPAVSLDATIAQALGHPFVSTVVLSSVRGVEEVKYERELAMRRKLQRATIVGGTKNPVTYDAAHRRLDQNAAQDNSNSDLSGVYYVQMTPNILAGLLFFFMFATVAMIGLSCMNMIAGQDVYVHTMPSIGREA